MIVLLLVGLLLVAVTVRLLIYAAVLPRVKLATHLREIDAYGFEAMPAGDTVPVRQRLAKAFAAFAQRIGRTMMGHFPALPALQQKDLSAAAIYDVSPETVHGFRLLAAVLLPCSLLFCASAFGGVSAFTVLLAAGAGVGGWSLPA